MPALIAELEPELVIVNGENAYDGKGLRPSDTEEIFGAGADVITSGNHIWERWQSKKVLAENSAVLRPFNYPPGNAGRGFGIFRSKKGREVAVMNLQGRTYMADIDCPFRSADYGVNKIGKGVPIFVDFHAEATAEKIALGRYLDGRVSCVIGTHTHVQTADAQIFPKGTAYLTDVGMTGSHDSVIGLDVEVAIKRMVFKTPYETRLGTEDIRLSWAFVEIDAESHRALSIRSGYSPEMRRSVAAPADAATTENS